jgi:pyridoxamine 5'-phosphate oxidase
VDDPEPRTSPVDLAALRLEREARPLERSQLDPDPFAQFASWFEDAAASGLHQPEGMVLASADRRGAPSARMVLLRGTDARGFVFFTNYESRKSQELDANPQGALLFPWHAIARQIRVAGPVERVATGESDAYFATRPRGSQLSAWASPQSEVIESREALVARHVDEEVRWAGRTVERPASWGGYRLIPHELEFWQGGLNRLHDRFRYRRAPAAGGAADTWIIERLAP